METLSPSRTASKSRATSSNAGPAAPTADDKRNYAAGIGLLLAVVLLWTASNFVTQDLFDAGYDKPWLVTYLNTCSFSLYLLSAGAQRLWRGRGRGRGRRRRASSSVERSTREYYEPLLAGDGDGDGAEVAVPLPPLTTRETAVLAMLFTVPWFLANYTLDAGLLYTSVASATILSGTSGFFTLCVGRLAGIDSFSLAKVGAVLTSFLGVVIVSLSDSSLTSPPPPPSSPTPSLSLSPPPPTRNYVLGDILALMSALLYALYVVLLKARIRSESRVDMQLFFGFVGAFNAIAGWPLGLVLHLTGVEPFEMPGTGRALAGLLINMAITLSSDFIYALAMLKTSPLVVTVGLSLTMPLAVIGDALLGHPVRAQVVLGAALVLAAFVVVGLEDSNRPRDDVVVVVGRDGEGEGDESGRVDE